MEVHLLSNVTWALQFFPAQTFMWSFTDTTPFSSDLYFSPARLHVFPSLLTSLQAPMNKRDPSFSF